MRVVCVKWKDSSLQSGWNDSARLECKPSMVVSYGWELENVEGYITLCSSRANIGGADEQVCGVLTIPRECIDELTVIDR